MQREERLLGKPGLVLRGGSLHGCTKMAWGWRLVPWALFYGGAPLSLLQTEGCHKGPGKTALMVTEVQNALKCTHSFPMKPWPLLLNPSTHICQNIRGHLQPTLGTHPNPATPLESCLWPESHLREGVALTGTTSRGTCCPPPSWACSPSCLSVSLQADLALYQHSHEPGVHRHVLPRGLSKLSLVHASRLHFPHKLLHHCSL